MYSEIFTYNISDLLLKYQLIFLCVLKVFDEHSGEINTKRKVKFYAYILKGVALRVAPSVSIQTDERVHPLMAKSLLQEWK